MKKALILVDFENEWVDENSEYFVGDISEMIKRTNKVLDYCRKNKYNIIFTIHVEKGSNSGFAEGTENVEIIKEIPKNDSDTLIMKNKISPFYKTTLENELKGVDEIVVCGILTNLCVRSLVQDAYDRDFEITIIKDCCVALDKETHNFTLKDLKETREEIKFLDAEEFMK